MSSAWARWSSSSIARPSLGAKSATLRIGRGHSHPRVAAAAVVLGVSRPTVVRMVEAGKLPARTVRTHRRLALGEVLAYREASATKRRTALDEVTRHAEKFGFYG